MHTHNETDLRGEVVPFYFGTAFKRLYGCYHQPKAGRDRTFAIVLCSAIGQEYLQSHRVIYQLAVLLSKAGFYVLRFDYFGCGDSDGEYEQGSIVEWTSNIKAAIEKIQELSGKTRVCLVGFRIGATLALQASAESHHVEGIILWEPVLHGKRYLQEIEQNQKLFLHAWRHKLDQKNNAKAHNAEEILGFPVTSELRREIEAISMDCLKWPHGIRLLSVVSNAEPCWVSDFNRIKDIHPQAEFKIITDHTEVWKEFNRRLTPHRTLQYIVKWLDRLQP